MVYKQYHPTRNNTHRKGLAMATELGLISDGENALENENLRSMWMRVMEATTDENGLCAHQAEQARILAEIKVIEVSSLIVFWHVHGRLPENFDELNRTMEQQVPEDAYQLWQQHTAAFGENTEQVVVRLRFIQGTLGNLADLYDRWLAMGDEVFVVAEKAHALRKQAIRNVLNAVNNLMVSAHQMDSQRE